MKKDTATKAKNPDADSDQGFADREPQSPKIQKSIAVDNDPFSAPAQTTKLTKLDIAFYIALAYSIFFIGLMLTRLVITLKSRARKSRSEAEPRKRRRQFQAHQTAEELFIMPLRPSHPGASSADSPSPSEPPSGYEDLDTNPGIRPHEEAVDGDEKKSSFYDDQVTQVNSKSTDAPTINEDRETNRRTKE